MSKLWTVSLSGSAGTFTGNCRGKRIRKDDPGFGNITADQSDGAIAFQNLQLTITIKNKCVCYEKKCKSFFKIRSAA